jgi:hypothetical protein
LGSEVLPEEAMMSRAVVTIAVLLLVSPVFAQEIDLGLGGDVSGLLNIPAPRGNTPPAPARGAAPAGRGAPAPARGAAPNVPSVDRLIRLREILASANTPLSKEQETALNALINTEIPVMRQMLQQRLQVPVRRKNTSRLHQHHPSKASLATAKVFA